MFQKAEERAQRLKLYVYGATGTGKTVTSLHFPNVAMIDTEKGSEHYGEHFNFHRIPTQDPNKVHAAIDELLENPGDFKTFVIDPFTHIYDNIIDGYIKKQKLKTGNNDYELQPRDYQFIKAEVKLLIKKLLSLDMNVIVTAPSKVLYSADKDEFMKVIGTQAEGPKQLPFMFDVVLELQEEDGKHMAYIKKDRTNKLPKSFEFNYGSFSKYLGIKGLEREAVVFNQQKDLASRNERTVEITYNKKTLLTAGIQSETLGKLEKLVRGKKGLQEEMTNKLKRDYMVTSPLDLREDEAQMLVDDLNE